MPSERRYDDREVGQILERVAELHEREVAVDVDTVDGRAMTRSEIEQVVQELGISTALVARATGELAVHDLRNRPIWWLGGKTDLMFEQVVDGHVDEATLSQMLEVLRRSLGDPGKLEIEAGVRIWSTSRTSRAIHFTVVEHAGTTTLRLEERMPGGAAVGMSAFAGGFVGFMTIVPMKVLVIKAVLLLMMGPLALAGGLVGWLGGRALWRRHSVGQEQQLRRAFVEIVALASARARMLPDRAGDG